MPRRPWIIASILLLLPSVTSCGSNTSGSPSRAAPATQPAKAWASTERVRFRPDPATQVARQPATTRACPPPRTLAQVLDDVSPSPAQRAAAERALEQAGQAWVDWLRDHRGQLEPLLHRMRKADEARDKQAYAAAVAEWDPILKTIPRRAEAWKKMRAAFGPQQQPQLDRLGGEALPRVGEALHQAVSRIDSSKRDAHDCMVCHRPHYAIAN